MPDLSTDPERCAAVIKQAARQVLETCREAHVVPECLLGTALLLIETYGQVLGVERDPTLRALAMLMNDLPSGVAIIHPSTMSAALAYEMTADVSDDDDTQH